MSFESQTPGKPTVEAEQALTEYTYAATSEGIEYGEKPSEVTFREATVFSRELKQLNPNWDEIDFNKIDPEYLQSLPNEEERINYAVDQLVGKEIPLIERPSLIEKFRNFLNTQKDTIGKLGGATAVLAGMAIVGGTIEGLNNLERVNHQRLEAALNNGNLKLPPNTILHSEDKSRLSYFIKNHPEAVITIKKLDIAVDRGSHEAAAQLDVEVLENGQTYEVVGEGSQGQDGLSRFLHTNSGPMSPIGESISSVNVQSEAVKNALDQVNTQELGG